MRSESTIAVASQLGDTLNRQLLECVPGLQLHSIATGAPQGPDPNIEVLLAHVFPADPDSPLRQMPAGWPFGLRWVQLISAGVDGYPHWFLKGPQVTTARGVTAEPIAEFVVAAMLAAVKHLPGIWITRPQDWRHTPLPMLRDSTLGLVGIGAIGQAIATKALALGMKVKAFRRSDTPLPMPGLERVATLEELMSQCDHVVLAAPATDETKHMICERTLAHAKLGLHLVNVARGSLVDQEALRHALDDGRIGHATLDVTEPEPLPAGHWLYKHPRVRVSPHTSAISPYSTQALIEKIAGNLERYRHGEPLADLFDPRLGY
jgi:phosphoglycerate dehydrogenase-like enzyme